MSHTHTSKVNWWKGYGKKKFDKGQICYLSFKYWTEKEEMNSPMEYVGSKSVT